MDPNNSGSASYQWAPPAEATDVSVFGSGLGVWITMPLKARETSYDISLNASQADYQRKVSLSFTVPAAEE